MGPHPSIATTLEHIADLFPAQPAIVHGGTTMSWGSFDDQAARLAGFLAGRGVGAAERVAIGMRNRPEYLVALLAVLKLRATPVNVNFRYRGEELHHILQDSGARVLVLDHALDGALAAIRGRLAGVTVIHADEDAAGAGVMSFAGAVASAVPSPRIERGDDEWLLYTGGTTGRPKAVVNPQSAILDRSFTFALRVLGGPIPETFAELEKVLVERRDQHLVLLAASPLMHGTGIYGTLTALASGGTAVLLAAHSFSATELAAELDRSGVTDLHIVGDVFARPLVDELERAAAAGTPYDLSRLRRVQSVGTAWSPSVKRRLLDIADVELADIVAATEGGPYAMAVADRTSPDHALNAFRLAPGARLLDEDDADVRPGSGAVGVLAAPAPPGIHYTGAPDKTAATFRTVDGVLYSIPGDLATVQDDGTLRFLGRGSGVINTGGEKVYAGEVEAVLRKHPGVLDAVVVGVPNERWGTAVAAVIEQVPGADVDPERIRAHVAAELASYKQPRRIVTVPEIQRTPSGKTDLRWAAGLLAAVGGPDEMRSYT